MTHPVRRVVIIGGGTAGWLSAAYLNRAFGEHLDIVLVESATIPRIGVGEATVPTLRSTFAFLGMDEAEWMPACNAAFKSAVRFNDWRARPTGERHTYYHPFFSVPEPAVPVYDKPFHKRFGRGLSAAHFWLHDQLSAAHRFSTPGATFGEDGMALQALCEQNKAPKPLPGSDIPEPGYRYAYHFDAALIAGYLKDLAVGRGVERVVADVVEVGQDQRGYLTHVLTHDGRRVDGDLFLDCSGFRGLLINQTLREPFLSEGNHLLCDSAVALPAAHHPEGLRPYTSASAISTGWVWEIPLFDREGTGHVYSSSACTADEAETNLRSFLGDRASEEQAANHIKMRVGRNARSWVRNCVAVGLSSCFVEPLESSTIALIEYQLALLVLHFPDSDFDTIRRDAYNDATAKAFEDIRDFIVMHYSLSNRADSTFWREVHALDIPESLAAKLDQYADSLIIPDMSQTRLFETRSIMAILTGMEFPFRKAAPAVTMMDSRAAELSFDGIAMEREMHLANLPGHMEYLRALREKAPSPVG